MADLIRDQNRVTVAGGQSSADSTVVLPFTISAVTGRLLTDSAAGTGTVTSVSVATANGFAGSVANPTTTPAITLSTTITGLLKGNGTAISAAVANTDYQSPIALTTTGTSGAATFDGTTLNIPNYATSGGLTVGTTTIASGTTTRILYDNAGVLGEYVTTSAATASAVAIRDSNANVFFNNYLGNATATASAGGTTVLTAASSRFQALTGSSSQTYQLPDATTLSIGPWFVFNNNSSNSLVVTNAGGTTLYTVPAGGIVECGPSNIGTSNGSWDFHGFFPGTVTWSSGTTGLIFNTALTTTPQILAGASSATAPSFIPQRTASTTGFGGDGTNLFATIGGTAYLKVANGSIGPNANDATALGVSGTAFSDLFLASGAVINFNAGNYTLTHSAGLLTANGAFSVGTSNAITTGTIELGAASDTTLSRSAAGVLAVEGVVIPSISSTNTLTNKRITRRLTTTNAPGATPTTNTDNVDIMNFTGLATAITSMTTNLSGTPVDGDLIEFRFTDNGTARAITWGASFGSTTVTLPTTTVISTMLRVLCEWNGSIWQCIATA